MLDPLFGPVGPQLVAEVAETSDGHGSALYDRSRQFRYRLSRVWDPTAPRLCFVMLNPSTATASQLDPTVSRTVRWARSWGYGAVEVTNIFAFRSTDPGMLRTTDDPVGPLNDESIAAAARNAGLVVAAWGVHGQLLNRGSEVVALLSGLAVRPHVLGLTKAGHPRHPLYLPGGVRPCPWDGYGPAS